MNNGNPRIRWFGDMSVTAALSLGLISIAACESTLPAGSKKGTAASRSATASSRVRTEGGGAAPVRLTVQGESVEAEEIWLPYMDELEGKVKVSGPADLEEYIYRRSGELITDKLTEMLLFQKAKLRVTDAMEKKIDEYVDAELRKRVTSRYDGVQRRMERELEAQGWSLDGYRALLRRTIIITAYLEDEIRPKVAEPTRAELMEAFRESADSLRKPPRRSMSLIDVRVAKFLPEQGDISEAQREEARRRAREHIEQARADLQKGVSFADAARTYSHALNATEGGAWGFVTPESVQERFAPAVARLQNLGPGQISEVIESGDSFFLVRCDEFDPGSQPDFQTVQPALREQLFARAYNEAIAKEVSELRKNARIEPQNLESFHAAVVVSARRAAEKIRARS